ncbi:hypothetical protein R3W88_002447 [Solanum pinnatisectum]|uniref:Uncharacterized protein n=1 Tax=Solanum pinnatisectum TaxID=50273 RepID=A0AAV9MNW9_9SOLN|nr:hypothetical protein R3W88_002447 [Solanum pinnatisectum]
MTLRNLLLTNTNQKPIKLRLMISNLLSKLSESRRREKEKFLLKRKRREMCFLKRVGLKKKKRVGCEEEEL